MRLASNADARRIRHVNLDRVMFNFPIWFQALVGTVAEVRVANAVGLGGSFAAPFLTTNDPPNPTAFATRTPMTVPTNA